MNRGLLLFLGSVGACADVLGFQPGEIDDTPSNLAGAGAEGVVESGGAGALAEGGSGSVIPTAGGAPPVGGAPGEAGGALPTLCGNEQLDGSEECDGNRLGDARCTTAGDFAGGVLGCDAECRYDFEDCYSVESVAVGFHSCAVLSHGKLKCWGANDLGQLGLGDQEHRGEEDGSAEMGANLPLVPLGQARAKQVTVGARHTCVLTTEGEVRCWGDNSDGQLGIPEVELLLSAEQAPVLDLGATVELIEAGAAHTCVLLDSGDVKCWGANRLGELGLGDVQSRGKQAGDLGEQLPVLDLDFQPAELSAGDQHTCALGPEGLKCWGATFYGHPMPDPSQYSLGDEPSEMGADLPLVALGWDSVAQLASGWAHNCALSREGSVKCWGDSSYGQLGYGSRLPHLDVTQLAHELDDVELDGSVLALSAGRAHTCALLTDNRLKCWGNNESGQLGLGNSYNYGFYAPSDMGAALPAVDLGEGHTIVGIQLGGDTSCAILDRGRLKCWGRNDAGALGLGLLGNVGWDRAHMGDALPFVEL